jgi:hypothetical protein
MNSPIIINNQTFEKIQIVHNPDTYAGFCAMMTYALNGVRKAAEANYLPVVLIDKKNNRFFYEPERGENIWEYYFLPVAGVSYDEVASMKASGEIHDDQLFMEENMNIIKWHHDDPDRIATFWAKDIDESPESKVRFMREKRALGRAFINKYVQVRPEILEKADEFESSQDTPLIGLHIRGTDLAYVTATPIERYFSEIDRLLGMSEYKDHKIFVATDQVQFIERFRERYGEQNIVTYDSFRGSGIIAPYRMKGASPYKKGEDVLIDLLILSKCAYILKAGSAVGEFAIWFADHDNFTDFALEAERPKPKYFQRLPAYLALNVDGLGKQRLRLRAFLVRLFKFVVQRIPGREKIKNLFQGIWY